MDIAGPEFKQQKRRPKIIWGSIGAVCLGAMTIGVSRLKPAAPEVERSTVRTDTVKRRPMLRQVRGLGSLLPSQEFSRQIPAEIEDTVLRILKLPGSQVNADTILLEMSHPQVEQAAVRRQASVESRRSWIPMPAGIEIRG
jgi:multidrug efflux pump subunit AcrA (membrane-fusion protein)